jgi:hypothetical protein
LPASAKPNVTPGVWRANSRTLVAALSSITCLEMAVIVLGVSASGSLILLEPDSWTL